jgi:hypothetical protein
VGKVIGGGVTGRRGAGAGGGWEPRRGGSEPESAQGEAPGRPASPRGAPGSLRRRRSGAQERGAAGSDRAAPAIVGRWGCGPEPVPELRATMRPEDSALSRPAPRPAACARGRLARAQDA